MFRSSVGRSGTWEFVTRGCVQKRARDERNSPPCTGRAGLGMVWTQACACDRNPAGICRVRRSRSAAVVVLRWKSALSDFVEMAPLAAVRQLQWMLSPPVRRIPPQLLAAASGRLFSVKDYSPTICLNSGSFQKDLKASLALAFCLYFASSSMACLRSARDLCLSSCRE